MATASAGIMPLTGDILIDSMTTGYRWNNDGPIIYSISDGFNGEYWDSPTLVDDHLKTIVGTIDQYIAVDFIYGGYFATPAAAGSAGSNINFSVDAVYISEALGDNALAIGLFPNTDFVQGLENFDYPGAEGDIFLNVNSIAGSYGYEPGQAGFSLALHELGHALGLKHPHDDGGTGHPTFTEAGFEGLDIDWLTVMSYEDDYNWNVNAWDPATLMILDVIALQYIYGADTGTNDGNDVYELSSDDKFYQTIFDAAGDDTLDLSGFSTGAYVELPWYIFSDAQYAPFGLVTTLDGSDSIAEGGSPETLDWILGDFETLIGTPFGDLIQGSDSAETIRSGGGFDEIYVGLGDDTVDGGGGPDWVYFLAALDECDISFEDGACIVESPLDGRNRLSNVETLIFDYAGAPETKSVLELAAMHGATPSIPDADDWRLLMTDGLLAAIAGKGEVFGTTGNQSLFVPDFAGLVRLDGSFNKGGDVVFLAGDAADWRAAQSASSVILHDGDTFVQIPVGPTGILLYFDDGIRTLRFDTGVGEIRIGTFSVDEAVYASISSAPEDVFLPSGYNPDAIGRLLLAPQGEAFAGGNLEIFGTAEAEMVTLLSGHYVLDGSFNKGGDIVSLVGDADLFEASVSGSFVILENEDYRVQIPFGTSGTDIYFFDGVRSVYFDQQSESVFIGAQEIGASPTPLTFA